MVVRKLDDVEDLVVVLVTTTALLTTACCCDDEDDTAEDIRLPLQLVLDVRCCKKTNSQQS